jgi:signal transduction histidine kinase
LNFLRQNFDDRIETACVSLIPTASVFERQGRDEAYLERYRPLASEPTIRRIALAVPQDGDVTLLIPDSLKRQFIPAAWPPDWEGVRARLQARLRGEPPEPNAAATVIELPRFSAPGPAGPREQEWLLVDLNVDYIAGTVLPALLNRYLGDNGRLEYDSEVVITADHSRSIYRSTSDRGRQSSFAMDAAIGLLDIRLGQNRGDRHGGPPRWRPGDFERRPRFAEGPPPGIGPPDAPRPPGQGLWLLKVHHRIGSLETLVRQARRRNILMSGGILVLIVAAIGMLLHYFRQAQTMAELQMNFVAGVSHEFRTPLTVIRTAAYNLKGNLINRPDQVERYGKLIEEECEKLAALVGQVLRYGRVKAGFAIDDREPVAIGALLEDSLQGRRDALNERGLTVEKHIAAGLPLVLADSAAMKQAFQNLLDNALKYGTDRERWIGVSAALTPDKNGSVVEIRIADRGPGIPSEERRRIFDPFFRGRRALEDQVHGTGLGLSLVKKIIEAHGGTIQVDSESHGAEFIIRLPAAPQELQHNEFADSIG